MYVQCCQRDKREKDNTVLVQDSKGNLIGNTIGKINEIAQYFKSVFKNKNAIGLPNAEPERLEIPLQQSKFKKKAVKSLKDNKSAG